MRYHVHHVQFVCVVKRLFHFRYCAHACHNGSWSPIAIITLLAGTS